MHVCVCLFFVVFVTVSSLFYVSTPFPMVNISTDTLFVISLCLPATKHCKACFVSSYFVIRSVFSSNKCVLFLGLIESQLCNVKM